ncbi:SufD family Fe-S cluster assembly protein [Microbacterium sp. NRRL B-14842]|uniref:SufB/SufD family protein n=1 Tax=Microbacterium sp. NRRL B-14842 TaxID=3162881 RepID=UPI003D274A98
MSTPPPTTSANTVRCDALLVDTKSRSDTYPAIDIRVDDVQLGHEATVSKVSEEQLFYLQSRGMPEDEAMAMIVRRLHRGRSRASCPWSTRWN